MLDHPCNQHHQCRTLEAEHYQDRLVSYMHQRIVQENLSPMDYLQDLAAVQKYCNHPTH